MKRYVILGSSERNQAVPIKDFHFKRNAIKYIRHFINLYDYYYLIIIYDTKKKTYLNKRVF